MHPRVGVLYAGEIAHGASALDGQGQLVDALVHTVVAHDLSSEQPAGLRCENHLDGERSSTGIVARVGVGMDGGGEIGDLLLLEALGGHAGGGHGEVEDLGDGGADGSFIFHLVAEDHIVGHDARLAVGRSGEVVHPRLAVDGVGILDDVAHGVDVGRRGAQVLIDHDAAALSGGEAGLGGQGVEGSNSDGEYHDVGGVFFARGESYFESMALLLEAGDGCAEAQAHALLRKVLMHNGSHGVVDRRHHLVGHLHHRHLGSGIVEIFGHLEAYEASADHQRALHIVGLEILLDGVGVGHIAQGEDAGEADAGERRPHRSGAGRQQQFVVALLVGAAFGTLDCHRLSGRIDAKHLRAGAHVDVKTPPEGLGGLHEEFVAVGDGAADVIGQSAVGIRDVIPLLEEDDLVGFSYSSYSRRGGGASGHSAR